MRVLYHHTLSPYARKVRLALHEKRLSFDEHVVNPWQREESLLSLNPAGDVPVLVNTGAKASNIEAFLKVADGVIVGSSLKQDGYTWNPVDPARVDAFMAAVSRARR